jgi:hypothetical protein
MMGTTATESPQTEVQQIKLLSQAQLARMMKVAVGFLREQEAKGVKAPADEIAGSAAYKALLGKQLEVLMQHRERDVEASKHEVLLSAGVSVEAGEGGERVKLSISPGSPTAYQRQQRQWEREQAIGVVTHRLQWSLQPTERPGIVREFTERVRAELPSSASWQAPPLKAFMIRTVPVTPVGWTEMGQMNGLRGNSVDEARDWANAARNWLNLGALQPADAEMWYAQMHDRTQDSSLARNLLEEHKGAMMARAGSVALLNSPRGQFLAMLDYFAEKCEHAFLLSATDAKRAVKNFDAFDVDGKVYDHPTKCCNEFAKLYDRVKPDMTAYRAIQILCAALNEVAPGYRTPVLQSWEQPLGGVIWAKLSEAEADPAQLTVARVEELAKKMFERRVRDDETYPLGARKAAKVREATGLAPAGPSNPPPVVRKEVSHLHWDTI